MEAESLPVSLGGSAKAGRRFVQLRFVQLRFPSLSLDLSSSPSSAAHFRRDRGQC